MTLPIGAAASAARAQVDRQTSLNAAFTNSPNRVAINELKAAYNQALSNIRGDISISEVGRAQLIARAWLNARDEIERLTKLDFDAQVEQYNAVERKVFGTMASTPEAALSFRDATDRAKGLTNAADAMEMLGTAEMSGDDTLCKAVVLRAWLNGWDGVIDHYALSHPSLTDNLAEMSALRHNLDSRVSMVGGNMGRTLSMPAELRNLDAKTIHAYAAGNPTPNAQWLLDNKFSLNLTQQQQRDARDQAAAEARARAARGE